MTDTNTPRGRSLPLNELRRSDGLDQGAPDRSFPEPLRKHYHQDGAAYRSAHQPDKIEFVDRGNRMHAYRPVSTFTIRSLVQVAEARGWKAIDLSGDGKFRSRAYVEAASRGMEVSGYTPSEKDQQILQNRADRKAAQANPLVVAFTQARTEKDVAAAAKAYPQLTEAFAVRTAIEKQADAAIADPKGRANWVGAMTDRLVLALHRGEKLPELKVREGSRQDRQSADQERE